MMEMMEMMEMRTISETMRGEILHSLLRSQSESKTLQAINLARRNRSWQRLQMLENVRTATWKA